MTKKKKKKTTKVAAKKTKVKKAATKKVEEKAPVKKSEPKKPEPIKEEPKKPEPEKPKVEKKGPDNVVELVRHSRYGFNITDPVDNVVVKIRLRKGPNVIPEKYYDLLVNSEYFNDCLGENIVRIPD